jgi:hypothetical protein
MSKYYEVWLREGKCCECASQKSLSICGLCADHTLVCVDCNTLHNDVMHVYKVSSISQNRSRIRQRKGGGSDE